MILCWELSGIHTGQSHHIVSVRNGGQRGKEKEKKGREGKDRKGKKKVRGKKYRSVNIGRMFKVNYCISIEVTSLRYYTENK